MARWWFVQRGWSTSIKWTRTILNIITSWNNGLRETNRNEFEFSQPLLSTLKKCKDCEKCFCPIPARTAMQAEVNDDDEDAALMHINYQIIKSLIWQPSPKRQTHFENYSLPLSLPLFFSLLLALCLYISNTNEFQAHCAYHLYTKYGNDQKLATTSFRLEFVVFSISWGILMIPSNLK